MDARKAAAFLTISDAVEVFPEIRRLFKGSNIDLAIRAKEDASGAWGLSLTVGVVGDIEDLGVDGQPEIVQGVVWARERLTPIGAGREEIAAIGRGFLADWIAWANRSPLDPYGADDDA